MNAYADYDDFDVHAVVVADGVDEDYDVHENVYDGYVQQVRQVNVGCDVVVDYDDVAAPFGSNHSRQCAYVGMTEEREHSESHGGPHHRHEVEFQAIIMTWLSEKSVVHIADCCFGYSPL